MICVMRALKNTLCLLVILTGVSCIQSPVGQSGTETARTGSHREFQFFPAKPDKPRIQYLLTIDNALDIEVPKSSLFKFVVGDEANDVPGIAKPYGVKLSGDRMYVCDTRGGLVVVDFVERKFNVWGTGKSNQLIRPFNVDVDEASGDVFVVDTGRRQVVVFDRNGKFMLAIGAPGQFDRPTDVAVLGDRLYVCDTGAHCVHVVDRNTGKSLRTIGKGDDFAKALHYPTNIDIMGDTLFVSDTGDFRVMKYSLRGKVIGYFGKAGKTPGSFARPKGIAVDHKGRMYVVDGAFFNTQVFDDQNRLLMFFPYTAGVEPGQLYLPTGISISYHVPEFLKQYVSPNFSPEYLIAICSQYGNKVNIYAFGEYTD